MNEALWFIWLVLFLVYEVYAALNKKKGDTLSETVGDWTGLEKWRKGERRGSVARRTVLFCFLVGLTSHLVWGTTVLPVIVFGGAFFAIVGWGVFKEK